MEEENAKLKRVVADLTPHNIGRNAVLSKHL
jgi:hypothetical protein